jgi:hypothetical protein
MPVENHFSGCVAERLKKLCQHQESLTPMACSIGQNNSKNKEQKNPNYFVQWGLYYAAWP